MSHSSSDQVDSGVQLRGKPRRYLLGNSFILTLCCCDEDAGHAKSAVPVITAAVRGTKGSIGDHVPNRNRKAKPGKKR